MAYDFPSSPSVGQIYTSGGQSFQWNGQGWVLRSSGTTITMSDSPPSSPVAGQLWWETDSGRLFIYFNDGNSSQWVQVNGTGPLNTYPDAPSDGNEYVRVNGVWRLKRQSFSLAGVVNLDIPVPGGAQFAKITGKAFNGTSAGVQAIIRLSIDGGSTFLSGASDYTHAGIATYGGSGTSPAKVATANTTSFWMSNTGDNMIAAHLFECLLMTHKGTTGNVFSATWRGFNINSAASNGPQEIIMSGYSNPTAGTPAQLAAFRITSTTGVAWGTGSAASVEWIY